MAPTKLPEIAHNISLPVLALGFQMTAVENILGSDRQTCDCDSHSFSCNSLPYPPGWCSACKTITTFTAMGQMLNPAKEIQVTRKVTLF